MKRLFEIITKNTAYKQAMKTLLSKESECGVSGLWGSSWAYFVSAAAFYLEKNQKKGGTILLITDSVLGAEECCEDIDLFLPGSPILLPPLEVISDPNIIDDYSKNISFMERSKVLHRLMVEPNHNGEKTAFKNSNKEGKSNSDIKIDTNIIVASIQAIMQEMPDPQTINNCSLTIATGNEYKQEELITWLMDRHFERVTLVESPGEFSLKGCVMDIFPYSSEIPARVEFFGDQVDSIRIFDVDSQKSIHEINAFQMLAISDNEDDDIEQKQLVKSSILSYLPEDASIFLKDYEVIAPKANAIIPERGLEDMTNSFETVEKSLRQFKRIYISTLEEGAKEEKNASLPLKNKCAFEVKSLERFSQGLAPAMEELKNICLENKNTVIFCNNIAEEHRFKEILKDHDMADCRLQLTTGRLSRGFQMIKPALTLLSYNELFKRYEQKRAPKDPVKSKPIDSFLDLRKNDLVVHVAHGIAKFKGIKEIESSTTGGGYNNDVFQKLDKIDPPKSGAGKSHKREYLLLEFAEGTTVYVPATNIDMVQKYIGPSEHKPKLSKLGSKSWESKKAQARKAVGDMANELISLQAARGSMQGVACKEDDEWQKEFEAAFIYQETEDQLTVAGQIKKDIEAPMPMDRLVCGDVGYGKTELAMRAAFKMVMNGKQVAVLVPTTILAQQHYRTFIDRMADYPVKIDVLSRFRTKKEQKEILQAAAEGKVDIVIGTHRLVQKDVFFKNIGLVVIDEEQKFGVAHKERFKTLRHIVDVLTLTATPIPRTLHMAMLGIRDISSLNTPPMDRKSIQTRIIRHRPELIRQIIVHELNRNGQIFFVHNRVYNIERIAKSIVELVPEAKVVIGHGQMHERDLEKRMLEFVEGRADILVSTTIIESGLDIPNVNTILINDAQNFGLADLHQLRGRVGRYKHRAFAYLIVPMDRPVTPEADKKLKAIEEFSSLGAGFKIAMRDLEIRGAGNFLGAEQHGHIAAVGYEMYCRLLDLTVKKMKNMPIPHQIDAQINLGINAYIPNEYISDHALKMDIYRKLNLLQQVKDVKDMEALLVDRFGAVPGPVKNLLLESEVRVAAYHARIRAVTKVEGTIIIRHVDTKSVEKALISAPDPVRIINNDTMHIRLKKPKMAPDETLLYLKDILVAKRKK